MLQSNIKRAKNSSTGTPICPFYVALKDRKEAFVLIPGWMQFSNDGVRVHIKVYSTTAKTNGHAAKGGGPSATFQNGKDFAEIVKLSSFLYCPEGFVSIGTKSQVACVAVPGNKEKEKLGLGKLKQALH